VGLFDEIKLDAAYPPTEHSVSALNGQLRTAIEDWIRPQIAQRPDLESFVIPNAPVGGKRIIRDNGKWLATLQRDNVGVIQDPIEAINESGILTVEGVQRDYDMIVYGTGFHASKFLSPVKIVGRDNKNLHDWWQDDARAYIGTSMPGFPNLFCMYGPNTNLVVNASIIMFSELTSKYIVDAVRQLLESGQQAMEVRQPVFDAYVQHVDEANMERAWGFSKVNSWYKNSKGRVTQNYPDSAADFWWRTHQVRPSDYTFS
jgi:4-hydroxyacetophenone monooxygenase